MDYQIGVPDGAKYSPKRGMKIYIMPDGRLQARKKAPWHGKGECVGIIYSTKDLNNDLFFHPWSNRKNVEEVKKN